METCDVLIVGGGPAGSTCACQLRQAGLEVMVADAATFPHDKVCAGGTNVRTLHRIVSNRLERGGADGDRPNSRRSVHSNARPISSAHTLRLRHGILA